MSATSSFQAYWGGLLNAAINSDLNKNDPYRAITYYRNMMAFMPPDNRPSDKEVLAKCGEEPVARDNFTEDPDEANHDANVREYLRKYSFLVLSKIGQQIINEQGQRRM